MKKYYVTGGEYTSTEFRDIVDGSEVEHGPFADYSSAQDCWQSLSMKHIDNALCRFQITAVEQTMDYWVVGGVYTDTSFSHLDSQYEYTESGPFNLQQAAEKAWRDISMKHIDNALARFRIEQR